LPVWSVSTASVRSCNRTADLRSVRGRAKVTIRSVHPSAGLSPSFAYTICAARCDDGPGGSAVQGGKGGADRAPDRTTARRRGNGNAIGGEWPSADLDPLQGHSAVPRRRVPRLRCRLRARRAACPTTTSAEGAHEEIATVSPGNVPTPAGAGGGPGGIPAPRGFGRPGHMNLQDAGRGSVTKVGAKHNGSEKTPSLARSGGWRGLPRCCKVRMAGKEGGLASDPR
jgi:hypothetical protein